MTQDSNIEKTSQSATLIDEDMAKSLSSALRRPIVLIGMMGSGKSRVGQILANVMGLEFADCDREIELAAGCSVADYFERYGEDAFRDGEYRVLSRLLDGTPKIISSGGGIIVREKTRDLLKTRAISVWLQADIAVLAARCAGSDRRPLLRDTNDPEAVLRNLFNQRRACYEETAAFTASSNHDDAHRSVREVLDGLGLYLKVTPS